MKALITGVSGQTGSLLAKKLLNDGLEVFGVTRRDGAGGLWRHDRLRIRGAVKVLRAELQSEKEVQGLLGKIRPNLIFHLSGPSSVSGSLSNPSSWTRSIALGTLNLLEGLRVLEIPARFFNAASTDCFGSQPGVRLNESSSMRPISPYATAKVTSFNLGRNYRDIFGIFVSNGILSNHESALRGEGFVTRKIVESLIAQAKGASGKLKLGDTSVIRDWMAAQDAVEAIVKILNHPEADDFVVGSGHSHSLLSLIEEACVVLDLDKKESFEFEEKLIRPTEISSIELDTSKARDVLAWEPKKNFQQFVFELVHDYLAIQSDEKK